MILLLLAAFGWGRRVVAGHGSDGRRVPRRQRGGRRDAVALGATVTVSHTIGVFALSAVALGLSQWLLPEQLYRG